MIRTAAALLALVPALALAGERTLVVKTFEDPRYADEAETFCASSGYSPVYPILGAGVWSLQTNAARGEVMNDTIRLLGTATACGEMKSPSPAEPPQRFVIEFALREGTYRAEGTCDILSVTVPVQGVMLVGCALQIVNPPEGVIGGFATSSSVFDGTGTFGTGSVWTLHLYTAD